VVLTKVLSAVGDRAGAASCAQLVDEGALLVGRKPPERGNDDLFLRGEVLL
jgi:hypothetical protein